MGNYKPETVDSKFMKNIKNKYETKQKDKVDIGDQSMSDILKDIVQVPEKLHMVGSPDKVSVKPAKKGENPLHTGEGKDMFDNTMKKGD